jgi:preprotein translocase subunit SecA
MKNQKDSADGSKKSRYARNNRPQNNEELINKNQMLQGVRIEYEQLSLMAKNVLYEVNENSENVKFKVQVLKDLNPESLAELKLDDIPKFIFYKQNNKWQVVLLRKQDQTVTIWYLGSLDEALKNYIKTKLTEGLVLNVSEIEKKASLGNVVSIDSGLEAIVSMLDIGKNYYPDLFKFAQEYEYEKSHYLLKWPLLIEITRKRLSQDALFIAALKQSFSSTILELPVEFKTYLEALQAPSISQEDDWEDLGKEEQEKILAIGKLRSEAVNALKSSNLNALGEEYIKGKEKKENELKKEGKQEEEYEQVGGELDIQRDHPEQIQHLSLMLQMLYDCKASESSKLMVISSMDYWYDNDDMDRIGRRLAEHGVNFDTEFKGRLTKDIINYLPKASELEEGKPIYISFNIGGQADQNGGLHWIAIVLLKHKGKIKILYKDSKGDLGGNAKTIEDEFKEHFGQELEFVRHEGVEQEDGSSCGPMTMNNLEKMAEKVKKFGVDALVNDFKTMEFTKQKEVAQLRKDHSKQEKTEANTNKESVINNNIEFLDNELKQIFTILGIVDAEKINQYLNNFHKHNNVDKVFEQVVSKNIENINIPALSTTLESEENGPSLDGIINLLELSTEQVPSTKEDFSDSTYWLTGDDIQVVSSKLLEEKGKLNIDFIPSIDLYLNEGNGSLKAALDNELSEGEFRAVAINVVANDAPEVVGRGNHWVYLLLYRVGGENRAILINSSGEQYSQALDTISGVVASIFGKAPLVKSTEDQDQADDYWSCGVWVLAFLERTFTFLNSLDAKDLQELDQDILVSVLTLNDYYTAKEFIDNKREEYAELRREALALPDEPIGSEEESLEEEFEAFIDDKEQRPESGESAANFASESSEALEATAEVFKSPQEPKESDNFLEKAIKLRNEIRGNNQQRRAKDLKIDYGYAIINAIYEYRQAIINSETNHKQKDVQGLFLAILLHITTLNDKKIITISNVNSILNQMLAHFKSADGVLLKFNLSTLSEEFLQKLIQSLNEIRSISDLEQLATSLNDVVSLQVQQKDIEIPSESEASKVPEASQEQNESDKFLEKAINLRNNIKEKGQKSGGRDLGIDHYLALVQAILGYRQVIINSESNPKQEDVRGLFVAILMHALIHDKKEITTSDIQQIVNKQLNKKFKIGDESTLMFDLNALSEESLQKLIKSLDKIKSIDELDQLFIDVNEIILKRVEQQGSGSGDINLVAKAKQSKDEDSSDDDNAAAAMISIKQSLKNRCDKIRDLFSNHVHDVHKAIKDWDKADIKNWADNYRGKLGKSENELCKAIAIMDRANQLITGGHRFRDTQKLAVLLFADAKGDEGHLSQIKTGEGKTTIVSLVSALKVLQGSKVDVITSNAVLADEGVKDKENFYGLLGISVAHNNPDANYKKGARKCYSADIVYGSIQSFQFDYLRDSFEGLGTLGARSAEDNWVVLDEVDSLIIDQGGSIAKLSGPFPGMESLRYIYINIWKELAIAEDRVTEEISVKLKAKAEGLYEKEKEQKNSLKKKYKALQLPALTKPAETNLVRLEDDLKNLKTELQKTGKENQSEKSELTKTILSKELELLQEKISAANSSDKEQSIKDEEVEVFKSVLLVKQLELLVLESDSDSKKNAEEYLAKLEKLEDDTQQTLNELEDKLRASFLDEVKKNISAQKESLLNKDLVAKHLHGYVDKNLEKWIEYAFTAKHQYHENEQYKIVSKDGESVIIPVDNQNTGVSMHNTILSSGLHQFLQLKHNLCLTFESLTSSFISNLGYVKKYGNKILGLTGTLGSQAEQEMLGEIYKLSFSKMPPYKESKFKNFDGVIIEDEKFCNEVALAALGQIVRKSEDQKEEKPRAVLIICESIKDVKAIEKEIDKRAKSAGLKEPSDKKVNINTYTDETEAKITHVELKPGDIVIATNISGRGTDFKTSPELEKNGGLHVIIGFLPCNQRVEDQALGRTARQGNEGSGQLLIRESEVTRLGIAVDSNFDFDDVIEVRDAEEKNRIADIKSRKIKDLEFKDGLFDQKFSKLYSGLKKVHEKDSDLKWFYVLKDLKEKWAFWLEEQDYTPEKIDKLGDGDKAEKEFSKFKEAALEIINGQIKHNPYYSICLAEAYLELGVNEKEYKQKAKVELEHAIAISQNSELLYSAYMKLFELEVDNGGQVLERYKKAVAKVFFVSVDKDEEYRNKALAALGKAKCALSKECDHLTKLINGKASLEGYIYTKDDIQHLVDTFAALLEANTALNGAVTYEKIYKDIDFKVLGNISELSSLDLSAANLNKPILFCIGKNEDNTLSWDSVCLAKIGDTLNLFYKYTVVDNIVGIKQVFQTKLGAELEFSSVKSLLRDSSVSGIVAVEDIKDFAKEIKTNGAGELLKKLKANNFDFGAKTEKLSELRLKNQQILRDYDDSTLDSILIGASPINDNKSSIDYWYDDEDMDRIGKRLEPHGVNFDTEFKGRLTKDIINTLPKADELEEGKPIYISFNIGGQTDQNGGLHWVAIVLLKHQGKTKILYKDSKGDLGGNAKIIEDKFKEHFGQELEFIRHEGVEQEDGSSCGPMTMNNLEKMAEKIKKFTVDALVNDFKTMEFTKQNEVTQLRQDHNPDSENKEDKTNFLMKHLHSRYVALDVYLGNINTLINQLSEGNKERINDGAYIQTRARGYLNKLDPKDNNQKQLQESLTKESIHELNSIGMSSVYQLGEMHDVLNEVIINAQWQIGGGFAALALTIPFPFLLPVNGPIAGALIGEGVTDIIMALIDQGNAGFDQKEYNKGKLISYGISIATMGIGAIASSTRLLTKAMNACRSLADKLRKCTKFKNLCNWLANKLDKLANYLEYTITKINMMKKGLDQTDKIAKIKDAGQLEYFQKLKELEKAQQLGKLGTELTHMQKLTSIVTSTAVSSVKGVAMSLAMEKIFTASLKEIMAGLKPEIESKVKILIKSRLEAKKASLETLTEGQINDQLNKLFKTSFGEDVEHVLREIGLGVLRHCQNWKAQLAVLTLDTVISSADIATYTNKICDKFIDSLRTLDSSAATQNIDINKIIDNISKQTSEIIYSKIVSITGKIITTVPKVIYRGYKEHKKNKAIKQEVEKVKDRLKDIEGSDKAAEGNRCGHDAVGEALGVNSKQLADAAGIGASDQGTSIEDINKLYNACGVKGVETLEIEAGNQNPVDQIKNAFDSKGSDSGVACFTDENGKGHVMPIFKGATGEVLVGEGESKILFIEYQKKNGYSGVVNVMIGENVNQKTLPGIKHTMYRNIIDNASDPLAGYVGQGPGQKFGSVTVNQQPDGSYKIGDRPDNWSKKAKNIIPPGEKGDRRHMLHWANHIRQPFEDLVNAVNKDSTINLDSELNNMLKSAGIKSPEKINNTSDKIKKLMNIYNSDPDNLVKGNEQWNKSIENARATLNNVLDKGTLRSLKTQDTPAVKELHKVLSQNEQWLKDNDFLKDIEHSLTLDIAHSSSNTQTNFRGLYKYNLLASAKQNLINGDLKRAISDFKTIFKPYPYSNTNFRPASSSRSPKVKKDIDKKGKKGNACLKRKHFISDGFESYYIDDLKQLLSLRFKGLVEEKKVIILPSIIVQPNYMAINLLEFAELFRQESHIHQLAIMPLLISARTNDGMGHWVGITIEYSNEMIRLNYLDSENQDIPGWLKQALVTQVQYFNSASHVSYEQLSLEQQRYNNCGPELVENFVYHLTGKRATQEGAVPVHSLLLENSLLDPVEYQAKIAENIQLIKYLSNQELNIYRPLSFSRTNIFERSDNDFNHPLLFSSGVETPLEASPYIEYLPAEGLNLAQDIMLEPDKAVSISGNNVVLMTEAKIRQNQLGLEVAGRNVGYDHNTPIPSITMTTSTALVLITNGNAYQKSGSEFRSGLFGAFIEQITSKIPYLLCGSFAGFTNSITKALNGAILHNNFVKHNLLNFVYGDPDQLTAVYLVLSDHDVGWSKSNGLARQKNPLQWGDSDFKEILKAVHPDKNRHNPKADENTQAINSFRDLVRGKDFDQDLLSKAWQKLSQQLNQKLAQLVPPELLPSPQTIQQMQNVIHGMNIGFKGLDTVVDLARVTYEPTMPNAKKLVIDCAQLYSLDNGGNWFSSVIVTADVLNLAYNGQYYRALEQAGTTMFYMSLPYMLSHTNKPIALSYGFSMAVYSGYNAIANAYSFMQEDSIEAKLKSAGAYQDLAQAFAASSLQHVYDFKTKAQEYQLQLNNLMLTIEKSSVQKQLQAQGEFGQKLYDYIYAPALDEKYDLLNRVAQGEVTAEEAENLKAKEFELSFIDQPNKHCRQFHSANDNIPGEHYYCFNQDEQTIEHIVVSGDQRFEVVELL